MSAYMDLNNVPASGNRWLLHDILRGEWGFQGFVVSDAFAVGSLVTQGFARDGRDAAFRALSAGLDMDMASNTYSGAPRWTGRRRHAEDGSHRCFGALNSCDQGAYGAV